MKKLIILLVSLFSSFSFSSELVFDNYILTSSIPANHSSIISSRSWSNPIPYGHGNVINCNGSNYETSADCYFNIDIFKHVPSHAKAVRLKVKAKAWAITGEGYYNNCLIFARAFSSDGDHGNHFIHSETWGYGSEQRRRVEYSDIDIPISGNSVRIDVGREIKGECNVEIVIYLEGYWV